jgi:lysyl-tRNA synthetase class 1
MPLSGTEFIFETGYGPSGLPHIGTFTEVARTEWVMHAHAELYGNDYPRKLVVFSDDWTPCVSAPENVPNQEMLEQHLGIQPQQRSRSVRDAARALLRITTRALQFPRRASASCTSSARPPTMYQTGQFRDTCSISSTTTTPVMTSSCPRWARSALATYSSVHAHPEWAVVHEGYLGHDAAAGTVTFSE